MQCWQDLAQFQQFLICMLSQAGPFPMQGVTDGSDAKAGMIGEWITGNSTVAYAAYPAVTDSTVSTLVLSPGDWDIWAYMYLTTAFGASSFTLSLLPTGFSDNLTGIAGALGQAELNIIIGNQVRANVTVPTLTSFKIHVDQSGNSALLAGNAQLTVNARRRR
jgi:hypothetical protein